MLGEVGEGKVGERGGLVNPLFMEVCYVEPTRRQKAGSSTRLVEEVTLYDGQLPTTVRSPSHQGQVGPDSSCWAADGVYRKQKLVIDTGRVFPNSRPPDDYCMYVSDKPRLSPEGRGGLG